MAQDAREVAAWISLIWNRPVTPDQVTCAGDWIFIQEGTYVKCVLADDKWARPLDELPTASFSEGNLNRILFMLNKQHQETI